MKFGKKTTKTRRPFRSFSLTFRLSLGITMLITFLMAIVGFSTFLRDRNAFTEEINSRGWSTVRTVQTLAVMPLEHQNMRLLNELVNNLVKDPLINEAAVLNPGGQFIAHSNTDKLAKPEAGEQIAKKLAGKEKHVGHIRDSEGTAQAVTFSAPIEDKNGQVLGFVHIVMDLSWVQAHLQETIQNILVNFVLATIAGMLLTRLIIRHSVHRPIQSLVKVTEKVSAGDFSEKVPVTTRDELGQLALAFNTMNDQLQVLFQSIHKTASDLVQTSNLIVEQVKDSTVEGQEQTEKMNKIGSAAKRLNRITNKLNSLALQYKTESSEPGRFW